MNERFHCLMTGRFGCTEEAKVYYPDCNDYRTTSYAILCDKCANMGVFTNLIVMTDDQIQERFNTPFIERIAKLEAHIVELRKQII